MHSANRAKQRLLRSSGNQQQQSESLKMGENLGGGKSRPHVDFGTRRSKSLDRKTTLRKVKDIRAYSPKDASSVSQHHTGGGPGSDSGLSTENGSKKGPSRSSPETENSLVESSNDRDSGRRSQSFEMLSDDLRSLTLSTPSSPSPQPRPSSKIRGHVHFMSVEGRETNNAAIVRSMVAESESQLKKSTSIPVHLTVSSENEEKALPVGLRPHSSQEHHESTCASHRNNIHSSHTNKKWASAQTLQATPQNRRGYGGHTPTGETLSSLQKRKQRIINNGYSSLPRSSSAQSGFLTPNHHLNYAGSSSVARSRSSASLASEATPKRPSSVASLASSSGTSIRTKTSRPKAKTVNASLSIWQIQKELKRGEMVQGVLHLGSLRPSFGSRIQQREEETCICAPVVIGGKNGHMEWKRM
eukprot:06644.XXX_130216_107367_1 [CDS] Oithona nana genome sequencing.